MENRRLDKDKHPRRKNTLYQHVYYDRLTGLPSMSHFFELAEAGCNQLLSQGKDPAILFINLSGMKFYNNKHGFAEGDKLIESVGVTLAEFFGIEQSSRFGQDHFAVFCDATDLDKKLNRFLAACAHLNKGRSLPVHVGVYPYGIEVVDASTACDRARYACDLIRETYVSNIRYFDREMLAYTARHQYIIDHLDQAIAEGWIQVYYQAIVRASNGRVSDEEALARWIDPEKGFLSPADFIPILEEAELIYKLDLHVIEQVLQKMRAQAEAGLYVVPQSVNLSRTDFNDEGFIDQICHLVDSTGIERSKLTLEITESVMGRDFAFMKSQVERLQKLGFTVWMDDFGSGYSSLDLLQNIRFDLIKLDMRFMERFDKGEESKIILTELVRMAIGLGIDTLAEGVETKEQVDFLREIGCSKIQGYYFTRPIPLETIVERQHAGKLIGFENPDETEYYTALGHINLYDSSAIIQEDHHNAQHYFDTIPMVIIEVNEGLSITRCNKSYREYLEHAFGYVLQGNNVPLPELEGRPNTIFTEALRQCGRDGNPIIVDNELKKGETTHTIINRIAVNPVTGTAAVLVAILAVVRTPDQQSSLTFASIARALSADYRFIYYVDLDTEQFVEYSSTPERENLFLERGGTNFFQASRDDSLKSLHKEDQASFLKRFSKENVVQSIDQNGVFTTTYRLLVDGKARYTHLKATRMQGDDHHLIIGVSDIDAQMRQQEAIELLRSERFARIGLMMLEDDYLHLYIVDMETDRYVEYASTPGRESGAPNAGEDFFCMASLRSAGVVSEEGRQELARAFSKQAVLAQTEAGGHYSLNVRVVLRGKDATVRIRAVQVQDGSKTRLVVGVQLVQE